MTSLLILGLTLSLNSCASGGRLTAVTAPQDSKAFDEGTQLGIGVEVLSESSVSIGDARTRLSPRHRLAFVDLIHFGIRQNISDRCELMASLRFGSTSGGVRCAFKEDVWIAGFLSELDLKWFGDLSTYNAFQTGAISKDYAFVLESGLRASWARGYASVGEAKWGGDPDLLSELFLGPSSPIVEVTRPELGWRNQLTIGIRDELLFSTGVYVELPVWKGDVNTACLGCSENLTIGDFEQGMKVGIIFGLSI